MLNNVRGFSDQLRESAVVTFVHNAPVENTWLQNGLRENVPFVGIMKHCNAQLGSVVLSKLVQQKYWRHVLMLLGSGFKFSGDLYSETVNTFIGQAPINTKQVVEGKLYTYCHVIMHCDQSQMDAVLARVTKQH
jgi:hypothetical protein